MTDPTDTPIEERLRAYGETLERQIDAAPPTHLITRRPRTSWQTGLALVAAAAVVVLGGIALIRALDRTEISTIGPAAPTDATEPDLADNPEPVPASGVEPRAPTDIKPPPDPDAFAGVDTCIARIGEIGETGASVFNSIFDPATETTEVVVLALPDSPLAVRVLLIGPGGFYSCRTSRTGATFYDLSLGLTDPNLPVNADEILLVDQGWTSATDDGLTGPGGMETTGRIGTNVAAVWVELPDGTALPGLVTDDQWFSVDGRIPAEVPLFQERYFWRLADGTIHSAPADQLDEVTEAERCAATTGCVEQRLAELQSEAAAGGLDQQADALSDGRIDDTERRNAMSAMVSCLNDVGITAELSRDGVSYTISVWPGRDPQEDLSLQQECGRQHLDLVNELHSLQEATTALATN